MRCRVQPDLSALLLAALTLVGCAPTVVPPAAQKAEAAALEESAPATQAARVVDGNTPLVELSPAAAAHIRALLAKDPSKDKLRISLVEKFGGDVHWSVSLTSKVDPFDDVTCESEGITIVIDQASQKLVRGTRVDFKQSAFTFDSPQLQRAR